MTTRIVHHFTQDELCDPFDQVHVDFDPATGKPLASFGLGGVQFHSGQLSPGALSLHLRGIAVQIDLLLEAAERGLSVDAVMAEGAADGL